MAKRPTIETVDASLKRWHTRLKRAVTTIGKLEKQKKRMLRVTAQCVCDEKTGCKRLSNCRSPKWWRKPTVPPLTPTEVDLFVELKEAMEPKPLPPAILAEAKATADDLDIPPFLQRKRLDPVAQAILDDTEERRVLKARGRIAKMKAKKSGETKRMPLSGKAALDMIHGYTVNIGPEGGYIRDDGVHLSSDEFVRGVKPKRAEPKS